MLGGTLHREPRAYHTLCRRHDRQCAFGKHRIIEIFLQILPIEVERNFRALNEDIYQDLDSGVLAKCNSYERESRRTQLTNTRGRESQIFMNNEARKPGICVRCGDQHWRQDCPARTERCDNCGKFGHRRKMCRNVIIKDKAGREKLVVEQTRAGARADVRMDNTKESQMRTVQGVAGSFLDKQQRRRDLRKVAERQKIDHQEMSQGKETYLVQCLEESETEEMQANQCYYLQDES